MPFTMFNKLQTACAKVVLPPRWACKQALSSKLGSIGSFYKITDADLPSRDDSATSTCTSGSFDDSDSEVSLEDLGIKYLGDYSDYVDSVETTVVGSSSPSVIAPKSTSSPSNVPTAACEGFASGKSYDCLASMFVSAYPLQASPSCGSAIEDWPVETVADLPYWRAVLVKIPHSQRDVLSRDILNHAEKATRSVKRGTTKAATLPEVFNISQYQVQTAEVVLPPASPLNIVKQKKNVKTEKTGSCTLPSFLTRASSSYSVSSLAAYVALPSTTKPTKQAKKVNRQARVRLEQGRICIC